MSSAVAQLLTWGRGSQLTHQTQKYWRPRTLHRAVTAPSLPVSSADGQQQETSEQLRSRCPSRLHAYSDTLTHAHKEHWLAHTKTSLVGFHLLYTPVSCSTRMKRAETRSLLSRRSMDSPALMRWGLARCLANWAPGQNNVKCGPSVVNVPVFWYLYLLQSMPSCHQSGQVWTQLPDLQPSSLAKNRGCLDQ